MSIGERIRRARERAHKTQDGLAKAIGVQSVTVSRWERGATQPYAAAIGAVARELGVDPSELLYGPADEDLPPAA